MNAAINYYGLLGLTSAASECDIRRAYRKRILEVHLDKLAPGQDTELCYRTIEAYRVLSNKATRTRYDILRDTELSRQPTDEELLTKYRHFFSEYESGNGIDISKLRAQYNAERLLAERARNSLHVSGAICYDVGEAQFSRRVAQRISEWETEFDALRVDDNYFESLSRVFSKAIDSCDDTKPTDNATSSWKCKLCDSSFLNEAHHWNTVLAPYVSFLSVDEQVTVTVKSIEDFFLQYVGDLFAFKPRYLPAKPSGIWGDSRTWAKFPKLHRKVNQALDHLKADVGDLKRNYKFIPRTRGLTSSESDIVVWTLRNQTSTEKLLAKASALLTVNHMDALFCMACVMQRMDKLDLRQLITEAFIAVQLELAMFWTMLGNLLGMADGKGDDEDRKVPDWFELGMRIHDECDPLLAHFCFLIGGYDMSDIADTFSTKGNHYAAAEWLLNSPHPEFMLARPDVPPDSGLQPDFYRVIYYSSEVKNLLRNISSSTQSLSTDLQRLLELMSKLTPESLLQGMQIVVTLYPREAIECHELHRVVIRILKKSCRGFDQVRKIVAAYHFLPSTEFDDTFVRLESRRLLRSKLETCIKSCDYELLTDCLLHLEKRNLPAAECVLQDYCEGGVMNEAMRLLIQGTIDRVKCNWLESMSAYQTALLSTPECIYRLVPCVSKLTQDEFFHESVLAKVQVEVKQLKEFFDFKEYLEIDSTVDSLVVSDPVPSQEFGYESKTSRLQQMEPQAKLVVDQPDAPPPPVETNTPLVTLTKNEKAIEQGQGSGADQALNAAFGYMDLIKALPLKNQNGPLVMAASHLLRAMDAVEDEPRKLFAYRNCILMMAEALFKLNREIGASSSVQSCLSHKHMFSIMLMANQKLSRALQEQEEENGDNWLDDGESSDSTSNSDSELQSHPRSRSGRGLQKSSSQLITNSESQLMSELLNSIVHFPKIEPLVNIPTLNCSDLQYVETVWTQFMLQYCRDKVNKSGPTASSVASVNPATATASAHLQAYTLFNEVRQGRSDLMDFDTAKEKAMQTFLANKRLKDSHVEKLLNWPLGRFTPEGWTDVLAIQLQFESDPEMVFRSIDGFQIDYETCTISFLVTRPDELVPGTGCGLVCDRDVVEIFERGIDRVRLTFEDPRGHPCQELKLPEKLIGTEFATTALRVAMVVNYFAAGAEVNAASPFYIRNAQLGFMSRLPEHLQFFCRSLRLRGSRLEESGFRFWLRFSEAYYEDQFESDSGSVYTYKIGNVQAELVPDTIGEDPAPALVQFALDFTRSYDEIGLYYPELARLKELYKISLMHRKLRQILVDNTMLITQNGKSEEEIFRLGQLCFSIRKLGISDPEPNFERELTKERSLWIPSVGCHNLWTNPDDAIGGGLCLDVEPIFGPVCTPSEVVPALRFFLSPDKAAEMDLDVTVEVRCQKSYQFANIIKDAVASNSDVSWWTQKAVDCAGAESDRVESANTNQSVIDSSQGQADEVNLSPESCCWKLIQSTEELYYKDIVVYKRIPPKTDPETDISTSTTSTSSDLQDFNRRESQSSSDSSFASGERLGARDIDECGEYEEDDFPVEHILQENRNELCDLNQKDFISQFSEKYFSVSGLNGCCEPEAETDVKDNKALTSDASAELSRSVIVNGFCSHAESVATPDLKGCENDEQRQFLAQFSQKYFEVSKKDCTNPKTVKPVKKTAAVPCYSIRDMEASFWRVFHIVIDKTKDCYACSEDGGSEYSTEDDDSSEDEDDSESPGDDDSDGSESRKRRTRSAKKAKRAVNTYYKLFYGDKSTKSSSDRKRAEEESDEDDPNKEEDTESESESSSTEESSSSSSSVESKSDADASNVVEEFLIQSGVYSIDKAYTDPHHGPLTMKLRLICATPPDTAPGASADGTGLNPKFDKFYIHGMNFNHLNALTRSNSMYSPRANCSFSSLHRSNSAKFNSLSRSASTTYSAAFVFANVSDDQRGAPEHVSVILPSNIRKRLSSSTDKTMLVE